MRKVAVVTGTRADYGIYRSVVEAMLAESLLEPGFIVTGMHLLQKFGHTAALIQEEGYPVFDEVRIFDEDEPDSGQTMAKAVGRAAANIADSLALIKPDFLLLLGDRGEMLGAAIAGSHMNIPVAHMHGGEVSGTIDEAVRHAISKLAHIHFPATEESAGRLIKMGEAPEHIFVVGAAGLDKILQAQYAAPAAIGAELGIDIDKPVIICAQHPVTTEAEMAGSQMEQTLQALERLGQQTVLIYPNSDAGQEQMVNVIKKYEGQQWLRTCKSLRHDLYLGLMKTAAVMVGNSSSGIIEAPSFGLPFVNVGTRQTGRQQGKNAINVGYECREITAAISKALTDREFAEQVKKSPNPYGQGNTGRTIADILTKVEVGPELLQKRIAY